MSADRTRATRSLITLTQQNGRLVSVKGSEVSSVAALAHGGSRVTVNDGSWYLVEEDHNSIMDAMTAEEPKATNEP